MIIWIYNELSLLIILSHTLSIFIIYIYKHIYIYISFRIGEVADLYRPIDLSMQRLEFTLVGFYKKAQVLKAIELFKNQLYLDGTAVSVEEAKPWLVELYPKNT